MTPGEIFHDGEDLDQVADRKAMRALSRQAGKIRHLCVYLRHARHRRGLRLNQDDQPTALDEALDDLQAAVEQVLQALNESRDG